MLHPNKIAIEYIWEKLVNSYFSDENSSIMNDIDSIQKGILHKPFHENSLKHQTFLMNLESKKAKIQDQFPFIQF
jgi:hypothetical protein